MVTITAKCVPREKKERKKKKKDLADPVSHSNQVLLKECSFLPRAFDTICEVFGRPPINLFATAADRKLFLYEFQVLDPMAWMQDVSDIKWNDLSIHAHAFPPWLFTDRSCDEFLNDSDRLALFWSQKEYSAGLAFLVKNLFELTMLWTPLVQPHFRKFRQGSEPLCLQTIRHSVSKAGFLKVVADIADDDLKKVYSMLISGNGFDSSVGFVDGISIHARPLICR